MKARGDEGTSRVRVSLLLVYRIVFLSRKYRGRGRKRPPCLGQQSPLTVAPNFGWNQTSLKI